MSNASSSSSINFISINQAINRYIPMPLLFFGIIGNILNVLVFTRKIFRHNICVTYFLASTIFNFFAIIVGLLPRLLNGYGYDLSQNSAILCKLRFFITYFSGYTAAWFISLACIERYLSSSTDVHKRQMITIKRAYLSMIIIILLGFIIFGEHFYCIDINQQLLGAPQSCYQLQQSISCQVMDSILQFFFEMLTPALMMIIFGLLTLENVRQQHRRIKSIKTENTLTDLNKQSSSTKVDRTTQKRDGQLITMLLVQVIIFVIFTFPISVYKIYSIATMYMKKSTLHQSIDNTIFNVSVITLFINNSITFYIYTLSGAVFRKELMKLFHFT